MKNLEKDLALFPSIIEGELKDSIVDTFANHANDVVIRQRYECIKDPSEIVLNGTIKTNTTFTDIEIISYIFFGDGDYDGGEVVTITIGDDEYLATSEGVVRDDAPMDYLSDEALGNLAFWVKYADYHKDLTEMLVAQLPDEV
jgi:hypothetical protein